MAINHCDMIWGGEDTPCAVGTLTSLGSINVENNTAMQAKLAKIFDGMIPPDRFYVTYVDVPRENMGYNGKTFAG